ncbi:hypothetical protein ACHAQA_002698 [Verticillium albo-atrum]
MRYSRSLVLFSTLLSAGVISASSSPRGVGPGFAKFYEVQDVFHCISQPGVKLSYSRVNDNTCDCPDGSDEPGTAACANIDALSPAQPLPNSLSGSTLTSNGLPGFWCANDGHISAYIPFDHVNDGFCDYDLCCDGSEEYSGVGGVECPNKCDEIGKEFRRVEGGRKKALEKAGKRRKIMVKESRELRRRVEAKIDSLTAEVITLMAKRDDYDARIAAETKSEIPEFQKDNTSDTDILHSIETYLPRFARNFVHGKLKLLRRWLMNDDIGTESRAAKAAREAHEAAATELKKKEKELEKEKNDLAKDYGVDDIFRVLQDKCVQTDVGEYEYELCWMGKTSQKSKNGHGYTGMGSFEGIEHRMADEEVRLDGKSLGKGLRMVLKYDNGQQCWNGPKRRTDVWLACSETEELWKVSESEKCVYKMEVGTPAACDEILEMPGDQGKDEL